MDAFAPKKFQPVQTHLQLGARFYEPVQPATFPSHKLRYRNQRCAAPLGLGDLDDAAWIEHFGQFEPLPGSLREPLALAYHGHQFRNYNPEIGDGRGFLFAQLQDPETGRLLDLGTKGSGRTPFSRGGDGRLTLKGAVREILATEMLEALGVNTSKTLSVIETGENLWRGDEPSPTRSAVLVRLSHGHIRIGSFQRLAFFRDDEALETLLRYGAKVYLPNLNAQADTSDLAVAFLAQVAENVAETTADWMAAGFVHGVLNTDNINITGESFDYGPWKFMPKMNPRFTAASFDHVGLYAYGQQPESVFWALCRLGDSLTKFAPAAQLEDAAETFHALYPVALNTALSRRLGISAENGKTMGLSARLFPALEATDLPFEHVFFDCYGGKKTMRGAEGKAYETGLLAGLVKDLAACEPAPNATPTDKYFLGETPCTMLLEEVEDIWAAIDVRDDWGPLERKVDAVRARTAQALGQA